MEKNVVPAVTLLKAMANSHRLMILCSLLDNELSVSALNEIVPVAQSSLSQHLAWLRRAGFVKTRRESQTIYYSLQGDEVATMISTLHSLYCK
ncbi:metalloregulator ArsR/SmtB family transcription factor [Psychrobium sp. 1_MG-2023]|uniref:ArsR/SmtB family transcription factor n=1 Tax=Psychrobium sp. 1_MG-2023 TaxID=3062624 RepID=UPI000C34F532|nr:metalloregulator ArsR/SmtB family transcription factor [Psychrobium sp. 1_MG-2023]MDP2561696.1 metalloregulator ArsR/SmtB family transcription factor [Psychrobium sp. 1_MG-2023]PKF57135.1 transcriptional regulator [Alteromonadales bacterium alter-6D02]